MDSAPTPMNNLDSFEPGPLLVNLQLSWPLALVRFTFGQLRPTPTLITHTFSQSQPAIHHTWVGVYWWLVGCGVGVVRLGGDQRGAGVVWDGPVLLLLDPYLHVSGQRISMICSKSEHPELTMHTDSATPIDVQSTNTLRCGQAVGCYQWEICIGKLSSAGWISQKLIWSAFQNLACHQS